VPYFAGPKTVNRPHAITADAEIPPGGAESVLLGQGSGMGGWSFYVQDGKLHYVHNYVRRARHGHGSPVKSRAPARTPAGLVPRIPVPGSCA